MDMFERILATLALVLCFIFGADLGVRDTEAALIETTCAADGGEVIEGVLYCFDAQGELERVVY